MASSSCSLPPSVFHIEGQFFRSTHVTGTMSIFSRFKKVKKVPDTSRRLTTAQIYVKPLPPLPPPEPHPSELHQSESQEYTEDYDYPMFPIPPKSALRRPTVPTRFSPEEAEIRIAAIRRRKSEMSLRATSPPRQSYAEFLACPDFIEPPPRSLLRVRSDMSMRPSATNEPVRPKTSSGHSTGSQTPNRYIDNYSFYAQNEPLREFGPTPTPRSVSAPQIARAESYDNGGLRRVSPRILNLKRPSMMDLAMEEGA